MNRNMIIHLLAPLLLAVAVPLLACTPAGAVDAGTPAVPGESFENPIELGTFDKDFLFQKDGFPLDGFHTVTDEDGVSRKEIFFTFTIEKAMRVSAAAASISDPKLAILTLYNTRNEPLDVRYPLDIPFFAESVASLPPGTYFLRVRAAGNALSAVAMEGNAETERFPAQYFYDRSGNRTVTTKNTK
jgi:hypothetical protein